MTERRVHRLRVPGARVQDGRLRLEGAELHYLRDVLRLRRGARVEIFDGEGRGFEAELTTIGRRGADLLVRKASAARHESPLELTLAVAVAKAAKLDWVVEKATELGVTRIVPFASERAVSAVERGTSRIERWRRIAAAAAAQSGRVRCPEILATESFARLMPLAASHDRALLFSEGGGDSLGNPDDGVVASAVVVTGPEGGFSAEEVTQATRVGFSLATLGPRVLRAETAAIVAVALAQHRWGDLRRG